MFSSRLIAVLLVLASTALTLGSCSSSPPTDTGRSGEALSGGNTTSDTDDVVANTVVKLELQDGSSCNGMLISPIAVLTAAHCAVGKETAVTNTQNRVIIGNNSTTTPHPHHETVAYVSNISPGPLNTFAESGVDIAIMFMDPTDPDSFELANAWAFRPTFKSPTAAEPQKPACSTGNGAFSSGVYTGVETAAFSAGGAQRVIAAPSSVQMNACFSDPNFCLGQCLQSTPNLFFDFGLVSFQQPWDNTFGDSGSPLFVMSSNGTGGEFRDVFGIDSNVGGFGAGNFVDVVDGSSRCRAGSTA